MKKTLVMVTLLVLMVTAAAAYTAYAQPPDLPGTTDPPNTGPSSLDKPFVFADLNPDGSVTVSFATVANAHGYDIYVYVSGSWEVLAYQNASSSFTHQNPAPGAFHWYAVRAVSGGHGGPWSDYVQVNVPGEYQAQSPPPHDPECRSPDPVDTPSPPENPTAVPPPPPATSTPTPTPTPAVPDPGPPPSS